MVVLFQLKLWFNQSALGTSKVKNTKCQIPDSQSDEKDAKLAEPEPNRLQFSYVTWEHEPWRYVGIQYYITKFATLVQVCN